MVNLTPAALKRRQQKRTPLPPPVAPPTEGDDNKARPSRRCNAEINDPHRTTTPSRTTATPSHSTTTPTSNTPSPARRTITLPLRTTTPLGTATTSLRITVAEPTATPSPPRRTTTPRSTTASPLETQPALPCDIDVFYLVCSLTCFCMIAQSIRKLDAIKDLTQEHICKSYNPISLPLQTTLRSSISDFALDRSWRQVMDQDAKLGLEFRDNLLERVTNMAARAPR